MAKNTVFTASIAWGELLGVCICFLYIPVCQILSFIVPRLQARAITVWQWQLLSKAKLAHERERRVPYTRRVIPRCGGLCWCRAQRVRPGRGARARVALNQLVLVLLNPRKQSAELVPVLCRCCWGCGDPATSWIGRIYSCSCCATSQCPESSSRGLV